MLGTSVGLGTRLALVAVVTVVALVAVVTLVAAVTVVAMAMEAPIRLQNGQLIGVNWSSTAKRPFRTPQIGRCWL